MAMAEPIDLIVLPTALRRRTVLAYGLGDAGTAMAAARAPLFLPGNLLSWSCCVAGLVELGQGSTPAHQG
ncbi:hypothetical protein KBY77_11060 [Synechococcus sp. Cruz-7E5]|nr:hypothetical protein [Synechococcus sp. Cruz-7E5]